MKKILKRCDWCLSSRELIQYHDKEWGVPLYNDRKLFEFIVLDTFQAGLSWSIIIKKRKAFREAFDNFNPKLIATYDTYKVNDLMKNPYIIRNKLKILSTINNAKAFLKIKKEFGTFSNFIWRFTDGKTIHNKWENINEIPDRTPISDIMAKELKRRGFKFVGSVICYAFMQASGIVNDHLTSCFRYRELKKI